MTAPVIVWFRDDLRLADHPALHDAAATQAPLICLYVYDEDSAPLQPPHGRPLGAASRWWLAQSLRALDADLRARGNRLVLRRGAAADVIADVARMSGAQAVHWNKIAIAPQAAVAQAVAAALEAEGVAAQRHAGDLLAHPTAVRTKEGRGLRVFTPFQRRIQALGPPPTPLPAPKRLAAPPDGIAGDDLASWGFEPTSPDWAGGLRATWTPGEAGAQRRLADFLANAHGYTTGRDRPELSATTGLSPHLRFGEIGPRQIWHAARFAADAEPALAADLDKLVSELTWRDFFRHLLYDLPDLHRRGLQPAFDDFPWRQDDAALRAWQRGRTGYPIVDAGMRQLWQTGTMHNRVRMIAASFLVKHLLIDWRCGEEWFWDTLVDADPGSNPSNWQWVAGCGADAAPYFRIFNPILQGEKFDPDGVYVARFVPELAKLPRRRIHRPWELPADELAAAGIVLGETYPAPIVDHAAARARALAAYRREHTKVSV